MSSVVGLRCLAAGLLAAGVLLVGAPARSAATDAVDLGGNPLTGVSTDPADPTPVEAGLWSDVLDPGTDEAPHQYLYRRTVADSQVHVGVVAAPGADEAESLELETHAADGTDCGTASTTSTYFTLAPFGGSVVVGATEPGERGSPCGDSATIRIAVGRGSSVTDGDLPVALRIVEEAPATAGGPTEDPPDSPTASAPAPGAAGPATGSTSFLDAPRLGPGTWSDTVDTGAVRLYRVRLARGQSLTAGVEVPAKDDEARERLGDYVDPQVELALADPSRAVVSPVLVGAVTSTSYSDPDDDRETLVDGVPEVSWLAGYGAEVASLPGDYWVVLSVAPVDGEPVPVPVELTVEVAGEAGAGPGDPAYPEVVTGPGGTAGPEGYAAATPYLVGPGEFAAEVPADPGAPPVAGGEGGQAGRGGRPAARTAGGAALGVLGLGCLAGGVALLRRRRLPG